MMHKQRSTLSFICTLTKYDIIIKWGQRSIVKE